MKSKFLPMLNTSTFSLVLICFSLQAIMKVKNTLHGKQNTRWNDLEMMTHFTHTGTKQIDNIK